MANQITVKCYTNARGQSLALRPGEFRISPDGMEWRAIFFDGEKVHEGPSSSTPSQAIDVLIFEMDEAGVNWTE